MWLNAANSRYPESEMGTDTMSVRPGWIDGVSRNGSTRGHSRNGSVLTSEDGYARSPAWKYPESVGTAPGDDERSHRVAWMNDDSTAPSETSRRPVLRPGLSLRSDLSQRPDWLSVRPPTATSDFSQRPDWIEGRRPTEDVSDSTSGISEPRMEAPASGSRGRRYMHPLGPLAGRGVIIVDSDTSTEDGSSLRATTKSTASKLPNWHEDESELPSPWIDDGQRSEAPDERLYRLATQVCRFGLPFCISWSCCAV